MKGKLRLREWGGHRGPGRDLVTVRSCVPGPPLPYAPQLTQPRSLAPSKGTPGGRGVKDPFWLPACRAESSQQAETAGSPEDDSHGQGNLRGWEPPDGAWPRLAAGAG